MRKEEVARTIAQAVTRLDPDTKIALGEPCRVCGGFVIPDERFVRPLWTEFIYAAEQLVARGFVAVKEEERV